MTRKWHTPLLVLLLACSAPAQDVFVWDSYAFYDEWTYHVYGFSRTYNFGRDWPVAVQAIL